MKNKFIKQFSKLALVGLMTSFFVVSCEEDDVFTGSPVGSDLNFITLQGSITTPETDVVGGQLFPVTISLGDNPDTPEADLLVFPVDVTVEAISFLPNLNKRARKSFVIPAGQNSLESTMPAPSGDATTDIPFEFDLQLYLSAIATAPNDDNTRGFEGKQYKIVSDTIMLGYGDSPLAGINSRRLGIRFDYLGPYGTTGNNLNIVLKKNGAVMPSQSSAQGVAAGTTRPITGSLTNSSRYESINFLDTKQELRLSNVTIADSIAGVYTVKAPSSNTSANDRPHNFKVGDEVTIENFDAGGSAPLVVQVATVADPYTFTFNYSGPHLFGAKVSFYQPVIVPRKLYAAQNWIPAAGYTINTPVIYNSVTYYSLVDIVAGSSASNQLPSAVNSAVWTTVQPSNTWSPFLTYAGNDSVIINSVTYYAIRNIDVNPIGNISPTLDFANWTTVKPKINWSTAFLNPPTWTSGSNSAPVTYLVNDVVKFSNVVYVCTKQYNSVAATPNPSTDTARWTPAIVSYTADVSAYTSTDTYTIEAYAVRIGGSTNPPAPIDLPYKFTIRFPDGTSKVYSDVFTNLTIGTAATAIPKLQIVKTTVQGVSSYVVTPL